MIGAWLVGAGRQRVPDLDEDDEPFVVFVDVATGRTALDVRKVDGLWCAVAHGNLSGIGQPGRSAPAGPLDDGDELWMSGRRSVRFRLIDDDDPLPFREQRAGWLLFDETWSTARGARGSALHLTSGELLSTTRSMLPMPKPLPPTLARRHASLRPEFAITRAAGIDVERLLRRPKQSRERPPAGIVAAVRRALDGLGEVEEALFPPDLVATFDGRFVATAVGPPANRNTGRKAFEALFDGVRGDDAAHDDADAVAAFVRALFPAEAARDDLLVEQLTLLDEAGRQALVPPWSATL